MGWLFRSNNKVPTRAGGVSLQTSVYGKPISIIYGTTRVSGNMLLYGNFAGVLVNQGQGSGKGGLFSAGNAGGQQYNYSAAFAFALCEGPIQGIGTVWQDKNMVTLANLGFTLFTGTYPQTAWGTTVSWSYMDALSNTITGTAAALGYNGIAYVADPSFNLGNNTSIPNLQFEVQGVLSNSVAGKSDADPSQVLSDFLTNSHYGLGFPSARIGSLTNWQTYCLATGLLVSPNYDTQRTGADVITELALATNTAPVWTSGQLTMVPYGDTTVSSSLATFTPNLTPIYALGDNDFLPQPQAAGSLGGASGPVVLKRKRPSDKINHIKLEYLNRAAYYAPAIAYASDQDLIDRYGMRTNGSAQMHLFCDGNAANLSASLQLRRQRISNTFMFDLDARYILLDPMDVVSITDSNLGLVNQLARIIGIQENDNATLSFTAEEILQNTGTAPLYNFSAALPYNSNPATTAGSVNTPLVFEPPSALFAQGGPPQIWIGASSTDVNWGGANIWLSLDNTNYTLVGQTIGAARQGTLTAGLPNFTGANPDNTDTLSVDLTESAGTLISGSAADAALGHTLCLVESELLSFQTATLTAANKYNLTVLYRGLFGTSALGHGSGVTFTRLDNAIFKFVLPPQYINQTIFIKLQSFNLYGAGLQSLANCTVYQFVPGGLGMVHPFAQALNTGLNQDLGAVTQAATVIEDYGFITGTVSGATIYYFPQVVDMQGISGTFSVNVVQASKQFIDFLVPTHQNNNFTNQKSVNRFATSLWFKRGTTGDSEFLWGSQFSTINYGAITFDTSNNLNFTSVQGGTTLTHITSTIPISDTNTWHHVMLFVDVNGNRPGSSRPIRFIQDGTTLSTASATISTSAQFAWPVGQSANQFSGRLDLGFPCTPTDQPPFSSAQQPPRVSTTSTFSAFSGNIAEYYYVDSGLFTGSSASSRNFATSTHFISGTPGFPLVFTGFNGVIDAYLNFSLSSFGAQGSTLLLGQDFSGENNNYVCSSNMTSTNQSVDFP